MKYIEDIRYCGVSYKYFCSSILNRNLVILRIRDTEDKDCRSSMSGSDFEPSTEIFGYEYRADGSVFYAYNEELITLQSFMRLSRINLISTELEDVHEYRMSIDSISRPFWLTSGMSSKIMRDGNGITDIAVTIPEWLIKFADETNFNADMSEVYYNHNGYATVYKLSAKSRVLLEKLRLLA